MATVATTQAAGVLTGIPQNVLQGPISGIIDNVVASGQITNPDTRAILQVAGRYAEGQEKKAKQAKGFLIAMFVLIIIFLLAIMVSTAVTAKAVKSGFANGIPTYTVTTPVS